MTEPNLDDTLTRVAVAAIQARDEWWEALLVERDRAVAQATIDELARLGRLRLRQGRRKLVVKTVEQIEENR